MTTYNDIKKHLNIKIDKHLNDGFAHLTHFWQNNKNGVSQYSLKYNKKFTQAYLDQVVFYSIDDTDGDDNPVSPFILKMKFIDGIMYGDDSGTPGGG
mgnify:CR=1 FL=1